MEDLPIKCKKEGCTYKTLINAYCTKHQICLFVEQSEIEGFKLCVNYIRGCRSRNDLSYPRSRCEECLVKDREKDKKKREAIAKSAEPQGDEKNCRTCFRSYPREDFVGIKGDTVTCKTCRESNKRADLNRDKEHVRELARENAKKPERKEVKQAWKENNYDKVANYWIDYRKKKLQTDPEEFKQKNAEYMQKWRGDNPEKMKEMNIQRTNNINIHYGVYVNSARTKKLDFSISKEEYLEMVVKPCYYCGILQEKGFNGMDRLDSNGSYSVENCVSCCETCNMMKGTSGPTIFIRRAEHILTNLGIIEGRLTPEVFVNVKNVSYSSYNKRAQEKGLDFTITREEFYQKASEPCYICGKETTDEHKNGIDRFDNTNGYTADNIKSCCWSCNFIKKNKKYDDVIEKLCSIYEYQSTKPKSESNDESLDEQLRQMVAGNKFTDEEKQQIMKNRKEKKTAELVDRYTNEDIKAKRIADIVNKRKDKVKSDS